MRAHWIEIGGFVSMASLFLGLGCAFLLPGKEWAAFLGTLPGLVYLLACHLHNWSRHV